MNWVFYCLVLFLLGALFRLTTGPSLEDRILALNVVAIIIVLIISLYAITYKQGFYLDIALIYAILSFGEVLAFVKFTSETPSKPSAESS